MNEPPLSEEEIRQLQAELGRINVDDVLIQTVVTLLNVGAHKAGLADPAVQPDLEQTRQAIEAARALLPLLEARHGDQLAPVKDMLAQLQMAYAQRTGGQGAGAPDEAPPTEEKGPEPPSSSGRLWVPGQ